MEKSDETGRPAAYSKFDFPTMRPTFRVMAFGTGNGSGEKMTDIFG